jgi:hypothetical protein
MKKKTLILVIIAFLFSGVGAGLVCAAADQTGTLELQRPGVIIIREPQDFSFPLNFVPSSGILPTYAFLNPAQDENTLAIFDSDDAGGFTVTVAMTDMQPTDGSGNIIHYTDLALVTLSQSPGGVDGGSINIPPGAANVHTYSSCPWNPPDPDMQTQCDASMTNFTEPPGGSGTSNQITILQDDTISDFGVYSVGFGFRLVIHPETRQGDYNGTLLFTLIPIP